MPSTARAGGVVAWWDGGTLALGVVVGEEKSRLRLVVEGGREVRVSPSRVVCEVEAPGAVPGNDPEQRKLAAQRVEGAAQSLARLSSRVEVPLVWEIVSGASPGGTLSIDELAELALEASSGEARAAMILALREDGLHFVRKGDGWQPRTRETVEGLLSERRIVEERARQTAEFLDSLRHLERGTHEGLQGEVARRYLDALERLAVEGEAAGAGVRGLAMEALEAAAVRYERPHEGAFRLLRRLGRFVSDDQNLQVVRFGLRTEFPDEVLAEADEAAWRGFERSGRRDLTDVVAVSIDGPHTREIDDALSVAERPGGVTRIGVHIADPSAFFEPGSTLDGEALLRSLTHYMPDLRIPMLPPTLSEDAASLVAGCERPALSFLVELDDQGEIRSWEVTRSIVCSRARLSYDEADDSLERGSGGHVELLRALDAVGGRREQARMRAGAILLRAPETELRLREDGALVLERLPSESPARRAVSEAMVMAGEVAARFAQQQRLPMIYRRQGGSPVPAEAKTEIARDPVAVRRLRLSLKPADAGLEPGRHASLGLEVYAQVTSPIRRFQDLASQRQIAALLDGQPACYDGASLQRILASTERATTDARKAERECNAYWMLRYLEGRAGTELEACVVQMEPRPVVQLLDTLREQPMPSLAGHAEAGQTIRVRVEHVNPRAGVLHLRRTH